MLMISYLFWFKGRKNCEWKRQNFPLFFWEQQKVALQRIRNIRTSMNQVWMQIHNWMQRRKNKQVLVTPRSVFVFILPGKPLALGRGAGDPYRSLPEQAQRCTVLCCTPSKAFRLCCAVLCWPALCCAHQCGSRLCCAMHISVSSSLQGHFSSWLQQRSLQTAPASPAHLCPCPAVQPEVLTSITFRIRVAHL